jgi:hypothetical protein
MYIKSCTCNGSDSTFSLGFGVPGENMARRASAIKIPASTPAIMDRSSLIHEIDANIIEEKLNNNSRIGIHEVD